MAVVILLVVSAVAYSSTTAYVEAAALRKQSYESLRNLGELLSAIKDAETGQRGYLLTGNSTYLAPYRDALTKIPVKIAAIRESVEASQLGHANIDAIEREIAAKLEELAKTIELRDTKGFQAALALVQTDQGKNYMDHIRGLIEDLRDTQIRAIEERDANMLHTAQRTTLVFSLGLLIAISIALASVLIANRDAAGRKQAGDELRRFRAAMDVSADSIYIADRASMRLVDFNDTAWKNLGYARAEMIGMPLSELFRGVEPEEMERQYDELIKNAPAAVKLEGIHVRKDGSQFPVEIYRRALLTDGGALVVGIARDVTDRRKSEQSLEEASRKLLTSVAVVEERNRDISLLIKFTGVLQSCLTIEETLAPIARYCEQLFPDDAGAMYLMNNSGNFMEEVMSFGSWAAHDPLFVLEDCWALRGGQVYEIADPHSGILCKHVVSAHADAHPYICLPMMAHHEITGLFHLQFGDVLAGAPGTGQEARLAAKRQIAIAMVEQITLSIANLKLREALRRQSTRDPLTGLYNRRFMEEFLEREFARTRRRFTPLALMIVDVDHFKRFNDTFGHEAGDIVLRELARFMQTNVRDNDIVCRMGGEEFAVVMPEATAAIAHNRAERLRVGAQSLELKLGSQILGQLSISAGIAAFPEHGEDFAAISAAADRALYRAKNTGRNKALIAVIEDGDKDAG